MISARTGGLCAAMTAALLLAGQGAAQPPPPPAGAPPAARPAAAPAPTPRTPDGKPDLNGYWNTGPAPEDGPPAPAGGLARGPTTVDENGDYISPITLRNGDMSNLTNDGVISRRSTNNIPLYKPEFWEKVEDLDYNGNVTDPFNHCMPPSIPRMGTPRRIIQTPNEVLFFYAIGFQRNDYRAIPIGPRTVQPDRDGTWMGSPWAHWEGDTLVVETIGFNDQTWFGPQGYLHGYEMKVTEKFRREGNRLIYESIVEDPEYLQRPWVRDPVTLSLNTTPGFRMAEAPPCSDRDVKNQVGKQREM